MFSKTVLFSALALFSSTLAAPALDSHEGHSHVSYSRDQAAIRDWHQDPSSETAQLFKRAPGTPGSPGEFDQLPAPIYIFSYAHTSIYKFGFAETAVGSFLEIEWQAAYPAPGTTPPTSGIPKAWLDRLYSVTNSSTFPKFGPTQPNNGYPTYANGLTGTSPEVCSFTYECVSDEDLVNAPDGVLGVS
jgi:chitin deacetylase